MKQHRVTRIIYENARRIVATFVEAFAPNYERAAQNRQMIRTGIHPSGTNINAWWDSMEAARDQTPLNKKLPENVPYNDVVHVCGVNNINTTIDLLGGVDELDVEPVLTGQAALVV